MDFVQCKAASVGSSCRYFDHDLLGPAFEFDWSSGVLMSCRNEDN